MTKKILTPEEFKSTMLAKSCDKTYMQYLAIALFNDPDHPIASIPDDQMRNELFKHIDITTNEDSSRDRTKREQD